MDNKSTLNSGELMNTDKQLDSALYMPETHDVPFDSTLNFTKESIGVTWTSDLLEGAIFIVSNGAYRHENIPSYWQRPVDLLTRTFDDVATLNDHREYFFHDLIKAYADLYNIDLHLIVYNNNKYIIIDKSNFCKSNEESYNRQKHAFIWCNADNTCYSPLYINNVNGCKLTVFETSEVSAWQCVESFVNQINQELLNTAQNQTEQHLNSSEDDLSRMAVDETCSSTNTSITLGTLRPETRLTAPAFIGQMVEQICQLINHLGPKINEILLGNEVSDLNIPNLDQISPRAAADLLQQRLMLISEVVQMAVEQPPLLENSDTTVSSNIVSEGHNHQDDTVQSNETNHLPQIDQNYTNVQPFLPTHLLNTTQVSHTTSVITPMQVQYDAPEILIQPKNEWHYRNMKDLGKGRLPLLAGDGSQRTPIRVKVPRTRTGARPMHLGVKIQTYDHRDHPSKVPVPEHTAVNMDSFSNDNNLNRLQFDQCDPMDYFDPVTKYVYLAISLAEHEAQQKDIRIHMFNLYQSGLITRDMIVTEQLEKCELAFWLCTLEDGIYRPISTTSLSWLIEES